MIPPTNVILITGGSGYLGRYLTARAAETCPVHTTYHGSPAQIKAGHSHPLDLADRNAVLALITALKPAVIIHTAAINPGSPEALMMPVNGCGSRYVAEGAVAVGARLVHLSTDCVHSGQNAPCADDAPPTPINEYGRSKAAAEKAVAEVDPAAAIVRTSLIYGLAEMDRGTAGFVKRLNAGERLVLFEDHLRQPVWVETLTTALLKLAFSARDFAGLLNVAGEQSLSRAAFAQRMFAWWGIDASRAQIGLAAEHGGHPSDLRLTLERAGTVLQMPLPGVDEVLSICKTNRSPIK